MRVTESGSIILSIKPLYWERIVKGEKTFEYRRRVAGRRIDRIYFYVSAPIKKILGYADIAGTLADEPSSLWELTQYASGIYREHFNCYFYGCKIGYAYSLRGVVVFEEPKDLSEFGLKRAPQSFAYVKEDVK